MQRYDEPVEVRREGERPSQLLLRGRLWKVRRVLDHRVEAPRLVPAGPGAPGGTREVWRVRAGLGGLEPDAVLDLSFDADDGSWRLLGRSDGEGAR